LNRKQSSTIATQAYTGGDADQSTTLAHGVSIRSLK
jgi:hypothetical protein